MDKKLARALVDEALAGYPEEVCGFVLDDDTFVPVRNDHADPLHNFHMDEEAQLRIQTGIGNIAGIYHSHYNGKHDPSGTDLEFPYPEWQYFIVTVVDVFEWRIANGVATPINPNNGRPGLPNLAYPILAAPEYLRP